MMRFISTILPIIIWSITDLTFATNNQDTINNTRAIIIVSDKTWISFNDAPLVEIDDELHPLSVEDAYNNYTLYHHDGTRNQLLPFSFLSPYVNPLCVVNGKAFRANVYGSFNISCSPSTAGANEYTMDRTGDSSNSLKNKDPLPLKDLLLQPNHGPQSGGTRVKVSGIINNTISLRRSDQRTTPLCRFGNDTFPAIEVNWNSGYIICASPPSSSTGFASSIKVDVSMSGDVDLFTDIGVIFQYDTDVTIKSLHPASGPVTGGTLVKVHGGPFHNRDEIICRFGDKDVIATYHDENEVSCVSPLFGWVNEVQRVSVFSMANSPEIQTISATVDDHNEVHTCQTFGEDVSDDEFGRGFRLVAPGGSIEYPLTRHTRWLHFNESAEGMEDALSELLPEGFHVNRTTMTSSENTFKWDITLPKTFSYGGETLHVVNTGGGAVKLKGINASVSCTLSQMGTQRLGGHFKLSFVDNGNVEETRPIPFNSTNEEMKLILEELTGIDRVIVDSSVAVDANGAIDNDEAFQWHVTFDSLKNSGDMSMLIADISSLEGSNASISIVESKKGTSHAVYKVSIPTDVSRFRIVIAGVKGDDLIVGASAEEVMESIHNLGSGSIAVEKYRSEYFFLNIMGDSLQEDLKVDLFYCEGRDGSRVCTSDLQGVITHVASTATTLGGEFSLQYPSKGDSCRTCKHSTDQISVFATAAEIETALEELSLVSDVDVTITESSHVGRYKVPVRSGILGANRNFYLRFIQKELSPSIHDDDMISASTYFAGDLPQLLMNRDNVRGAPTKDSAFSDEYNALVTEVVKGADLNQGGSVELAVSINGGGDFSVRNTLFEYNPIPIVRNVFPAHGSTYGGTKIKVTGDNLSWHSAKSCLFWGNNLSIIDRISSGFLATSPVLSYGTAEVTCTVPAAMEPQLVSVSIIGSEGMKQWLDSEWKKKTAGAFYYYDPIEITHVTPNSAETTGGTVTMIQGGNFFPNERLFCMFGTKVVPALFINPRKLSCTTPQHAAGVYSISVTQNGQDFEELRSSFHFFNVLRVDGINTVSGPSRTAGTKVRVFGGNFVNTTSLLCRFGSVVVPAVFYHSSEIQCLSPPINDAELSWINLPDQRHNGSSSDELFPSSHFHPQYFGKLVSFEVTNNGHDFTNAGFSFMYQKDIQVHALSHEGGPSIGGTPVFIGGSHFVNSTQLSCQFGLQNVKAHFLTRDAVLCFSPPIIGSGYRSTRANRTVPLFVSNNAVDLAHGGHYTYSSFIAEGTYQAGVEGDATILTCPRGTYCDSSATNFTLCTPGTYQPIVGQSDCISCPIGYVCSEFGMTVPRICAAGYVCDEKGMAKAKPCPSGYWCDRGTSTMEGSCMSSDPSFPNVNTCIDNSTDDFGLQVSDFPASIWAERHLMPLDSDADTHPIRGKFCLDMSCLVFDDADSFEVFDKTFDYFSTGFALKRPRLCSEGTYCGPGTSTNITSTLLSSPTTCSDGMHCPAGARSNRGVGSCRDGHYCRFGVAKPCPVATYCPHADVIEPLPCEPGQFNSMTGQSECSMCPIGTYCPRYGLRDPLPCDPGYVCSNVGLTRPNLLCPAGFYCQNFTKTSDPFRNDTTLRPYACTPGTYCFVGTGSNEVKEGLLGFAQPCSPGFFCDAASTSPKGSGACPPGFVCPKGTAVPRPTQKGSFAEHPGLKEATACLPGFYAPTIENRKCYECPPGTSCDVEGLFHAEECPPGTYRSSNDEDGYDCVPCSQGTWSKNWQLREKGECTRCPPGTVCPLDGMTNPCSFSDLPQPYEPIVNFKGIPALEYNFPSSARPPPFTIDECLSLNTDSKHHFRDHEFFFGELIPPYIDILGRGPHFRPSDTYSLKYQSVAKCYKNSQPIGSHVYQRMATYYGPQFDIQTGFPHQGYGSSLLKTQIFAVAPPKGFDFSLRYGYFRGEGNGFINLPKARIYDSNFNCTKGIKLMNSTLLKDDFHQVVYTDAAHDYEGGYDIEKCGFYDQDLKCYIDMTYQLHAKGECCNIDKFHERAIYLAHDQFYPGTCEADLICAEGRTAVSEAKTCDNGFVCDEKTSLDEGRKYPCAAGYVCDAATTPDTKLHAPSNQLKQLCREGHFCDAGTGTKDKLKPCPKNYFCPTGTANPILGTLANDAMIRMLDGENRSTSSAGAYYLGDDSFALTSSHDTNCKAATLPSLHQRFKVTVKDVQNENSIEYLDGKERIPTAIAEAAKFEENCARDDKSYYVEEAMRRKECDCHSQFFTLATVYRFWKCTSELPLDDLGLADASIPSLGGGKRDFWFPGSRVHLDQHLAIKMDPSMQPYGLNYGIGQTCTFNHSTNHISLVEGRIPYERKERMDYSSGILLQFTSANFTAFGAYADLKRQVREEYMREHNQLKAGFRDDIDPFVFDLHTSIQLIEQFGQKLEHLVYLQATNKASMKSTEVFDWQSNATMSNLFELSGSLDWCECQDLLKCPNGTITNGKGATSIDECISTKDEILHRISLLPSTVSSSTTSPPTLEGTIDDSPSLHLDPYDVAVLTIDQSMLPNNLTYGEHYRISVYDGCKPCPLRYKCSTESSSCHNPPVAKQYELLNQCLKDNRKNVCLLADGTPEDVEKCQTMLNETDVSSKNQQVLLFSEPDIKKCISRPYFCSPSEWKFLTFRRLCQDSLPNGELSAIYDCADVNRWEVYSKWRDKLCCSSVPELRGIDSCDQVRSVCASNPLIEVIIRDKLIGIFEVENEYLPPLEQPLGQLLMNATMQENRDHDTPFELFNTWQSPSEARNHKPRLNQPWIQNEGCCECKTHPMPQFFHSSRNVSGYPDDKHQPIQITISALEAVDVSVAVELVHGRYYAEFNDYFGAMDKTSLRIHHPKRFTDESIGGMWLSIVEESTFDNLNLDLPLNLPLSRVNAMKSRFLLDRPSNHSIGYPDFQSLRDVTTLSAATVDPFGPASRFEDFIALPYLPFLSNCDGYDSHISLSRLLEEHPDCQAVDLEETMPTKEYSFWGKDPISDACLGIILKCTFEEKVSETRNNLRWFEVPPKSKLFYITRDPVSAQDFSPGKDSGKWGRTRALDSLRNSYDAIPVSVDKNLAGHRHAIPKNVELELKYYQVTKEKKRLVEATIFFSDLCTTQAPQQFGGSHEILDLMNERGIHPCEVDINGEIKSQGYNLEIHYYPLPWFDLLNRFEFSQGIYFIFYTVIALVICSIGGFVYGTNRILTKLRYPPRFVGMSLLQLISRPQLEGLLLAIIPYMAAILTIHSWFSDSSSWFEGVRGVWSDDSKVDAKTEMNNSMCRLGSALVVLGFFTIYRTTQVLIPSKAGGSSIEAQQSEGSLTSKRSHFLWISLAIEAILMCVWEFSYSDTFKNNLFRFKVLFQMMQILLDLLLSFIMGDRLLAAPLLVSIQMAEMLITCGAHNFVDFTLVFLLEVSLNVFQRLLLYPLIKTTTVLWPRWKILVSRAVNNRGLTIEAKKQREWTLKSVNEEIEFRTEGIEPLLDSLSIYSMEKTGGMLLPFMCLLLILLYRETEIASRYNINQHDLLYYCLFAFYMIPWMSVVDSLVLSSQELLYGWRMHDYLSFQKWRFANRANMWNLLSQKDDSVSKSLQNMDLLCFSSQYYFILTLISIGFGTNMLGLTICLRKKYNFLADPVFPLIVAVVILWSELIARVCVLISNNKVEFICWNGIWRVAERKGVMDDVIAAKLAIGEGRQEDLEEERHDLVALNSDSFRRNFIDKNRPWILQHLIQLITPRSLQSIGPDNRPLVDYVRDVYSDLQTVGEGARRPGDNADISSDDSSDDEFEMRRQWERKPLDGSRLLIAQIWLQKARKRRVFTSTISGIIDKRKDDHCHSCYQTYSYDSLTAGLAWEGDYSTTAIDNLIHLFEDSYGPEECSPDLWKAFFRKHALFYTICSDCTKKTLKSSRASALHNIYRPGSVSSDDETNSQVDEDDGAMEMTIFDPDTTEGTMLSRWLCAARDKLGDTYPRGSIESTQLYLEQMQIKDDRKGRKANWQEFEEINISDKARNILLNWLNQARSG